MTDYPSFTSEDDTEDTGRIVYVREVKAVDLPEAIREQTGGLDHLYSIHAQDGELLALVSDRAQAFVVARQNSFSPVSVH